jgi:hypothetical protein
MDEVQDTEPIDVSGFATIEKQKPEDMMIIGIYAENAEEMFHIDGNGDLFFADKYKEDPDPIVIRFFESMELHGKQWLDEKRAAILEEELTALDNLKGRIEEAIEEANARDKLLDERDATIVQLKEAIAGMEEKYLGT